ncbi:P-loop containing nucleoside triphosphate hydrolase protein [Lactarius pseudohatsudake]|nr:P-loop containing nucleoside triphosphate hydrolase protein [Lactarius pseudohatsudake]
MTRDKTRAKEKARAEPLVHEGEDSEEDAYGSDDPEHQNPSQDLDHSAAPDAPDGEVDGAPQGSPKGHKRSRINSAGQGAPVQVKAEKIKSLFEPLVRDTDGYVPGSIVRVQLHNFLTYDHVEFRPGPHLNMIIGPNGTGKSSIACAIALGLNWPPSILGRASELNSFVKIGAPDGYIEIELKGKIGKQNLVVRRNLSSSSKGSTYSLNGQSATGREVTQKMNELNVQVGNLCSFLPQDKVSEFAHMSPQQLLRETQRAAGDPRLTNWHDTLISAGKEMAQLVEVLNSEKQQLKTLEDRNATLEREVQRFNERREFERQIALVELILPFMEYMEAKRYYTDVKAKQRSLHRRVQTLQQKNQPIHNFKKQLDTRLKRLGEQRDGKKEATRKRFKAMKAKQDESEKLDTQAEEISNKLSNLKNAEKARAKKIQDTEANVRRLQADLEKPRDVESMEDLEEEGRRLAQSNTGLRQRQFELREQQQRFIDDESRAKAEITEGERALKQLDDVSHRKLQGLAKFDPDCAAVIHWLRKNTHRFRMEIIEPAAVSLTVPNKNYVNAVEACFNTAQLKTFVAQCNDDYKLLNQLVSDTTEALGKQVRITTWFRPGDANITPPPMNQDELREIGFDGYAIDFVDCPPPMRVFLMRECQLHRTAIALQPNRVDPARAMEAVSRTGGGSYILGNILNSVMRSHYGRRLPQNLTRDVRPARTLVGPVADPAARQNIERRIAQGRDQLALCAEEGQRLGELDREIKGEQNAYKAASDKLRARKQAVADEKRRVNAAETRLRTQQDRLTEMRKEKSTDKERADLKKSLLKVTRQRTDVAQQYAGLVRLTIKDQTDATKFGLEHLQESSRKHALEVLLKECDGEYQTALTEFNAANATYVREKERCKELLDVSKAKLDEVDDELRDTFKAMEESGKAHERTADQLKDELETLRQKLELVLAADPGVIDQYERRKEEIKTLTKKIEDRERAAAKVEKSMKVARDNWHPALQDLVTSIGKRFSEAFDRIGCAGELQLAPHDDYEKWAITILVKFRDTEQLQQLTAHRQSGGERSLTTILYLMSMTEYARAPFSLVDEINQGMDQRAERAVHNELVKTTCKVDSGQYFLITPKLLPDLKYDRLMKVLCVNNGEWLPEDNSLGNMMSMIRNYVTKRGSSGAASV